MRPLHHCIAVSVALGCQQQPKLQFQIQAVRMIDTNRRRAYRQRLAVTGFGGGGLALRLRKLRSGLGDD